MATKICDLKPGVEYELKCEDEWGDGWNEGYIEIAGLTYCENFGCDYPKTCQYCYGCNTNMSIRYIKVSGTIVIHLSRNYIGINDLF